VERAAWGTRNVGALTFYVAIRGEKNDDDDDDDDDATKAGRTATKDGPQRPTTDDSDRHAERKN